MWYYKDKIRAAILRYKFYSRRHYAKPFGRFLAMKLLEKDKTDFDLITWVPISRRRKWRRGFDQVELLAQEVTEHLQIPLVDTLKKIRHTPPQSGLGDVSRRRANVLGAYRCIRPKAVRGKRILLLDDIITTGATLSECARVLLTAGGSEVHCAVVAATRKHKQ